MVDTISARYNASEHQHRTLTLGIGIAHFSGLNEGVGDSGSLAATNGAREETIFSTRGDGTD